MPSSSCRALSAWCPSTTSSGARPPASARRTAPRSTLSPSSSNSSLLHPMRLEVPAASSTPATVSTGMDRLLPRREMARLSPGGEGEQLGDDADRDLSRPVGAQIEAKRAEHPLPLGRAVARREAPLPGGRRLDLDVDVAQDG